MKIFALIPRDFNLSKKLTILMLTIFLGGIIVSSITYYNILLENAKNELTIRANILISTMDSVRKYNNDKVKPLLLKQSEDKLLLESIPSFAVHGVFDILINTYKDQYGEYSYKDAMINPTNIKDQADNKEIKVVAKLAQQEELSQENSSSIAQGWKNIDQGFIMINGEKKFYTARPIKITQSSCLACHTSLEKSPNSLKILYQEGKYEDNQGFGWKLNKVIGAKIVYIPANQVYKTANKYFVFILGIFTAIFAVAIFLVNLWLKQYVVRPLNKMSQIAEAVSMGDIDSDFEKQSNDEIGRLAESFTRLKTSLVIAMKRLIQKSHRPPDESQ